jgi:choline dehydrogenase-like flavoprotein
VAAVLAKAGCDVIVLEAGGYFDDADFDGDALRGFERLYAESGNSATWDRSVNLLAGECLGGGTVVNYCTSFRTPDDVRAEWAAAGVPWFTQDAYTRSLDAVCARLSVNLEHNRVSAREQVLQRGLQSLGWHCAPMPRNVVGCEQGKICGYCGFGCTIGAKQSAAKTWLVDAQDAGARLYVQTRAERILVQAGRAVGVEARTKGGQRASVRCASVVPFTLPRYCCALAYAMNTSAATCIYIPSRTYPGFSPKRFARGKARCKRSTPTSFVS